MPVCNRAMRVGGDPWLDDAQRDDKKNRRVRDAAKGRGAVRGADFGERSRLHIVHEPMRRSWWQHEIAGTHHRSVSCRAP